MKYWLKKTGTLIITLLLISFLAFFAFQVLSGDPATSMLGTSATPERLAALREEMGLNDPVLLRYVRWLADFVRGDFGISYSYHIPVSEMMHAKIPITLTLTLMAGILILLLAIPIGIYSAKHQGSLADRLVTIINQVIMSVPPFFSGMVLTVIFGSILHWFQPGAYVSYTSSVPGFLWYLVFPAIAIALPKAAMTIKMLRNSLLQEMKSDYVRTAYSKGNTDNQVLYGHVLRNAFMPVLTFLGMTISDMIAYGLVVEQVFGIPGLGRMLVSGISQRDFPVVCAIIVLIGAMVVIINFIVDALYKVLDPRI